MQLLKLTVFGLFLVIATLIEDNNAWWHRQKVWKGGKRWKLVRPSSYYSNCTVTHNTYEAHESYRYNRGLTEVRNINKKIC